MGNNQSCEVVGIRIVNLKLKDDTERVLKNVRHVPSSKKNLISLRDGSGLKITRGFMAYFRREMKNETCLLKGGQVMPSVAVGEEGLETQVQLWHKRLTHVNEKGLIELNMQGLLGDLRDVKLPFFENCVIGKAKRKKVCKECKCHGGETKLCTL